MWMFNKEGKSKEEKIFVVLKQQPLSLFKENNADVLKTAVPRTAC